MAIKRANPSELAQQAMTKEPELGLRHWLAQLDDDDASLRREAARSLSSYPVAAPALLSALSREPDLRVKGSILVSLHFIGGARVFEGLVPFLRSEDVGLRNGVIEILQSMPTEVALHINELLADDDSDVRIFAIDILQTLAHPDSPTWLVDVLKKEKHINVVAATVDRLIEIGDASMIPAIQYVEQRFPNEPYIKFIVTLAIERLTEE